MTVSQLYALYCAGHAQARSLAHHATAPGGELIVSGARITTLERLILELALLDATNGTALRSARGFERALAQGAEVLSALGLVMDGEGALVPDRGLDEAA